MAETGWNFNPLVAIGIFLAFMFFGYFFGLFEGRSQGYKKRQKEETDELRHQSVPPLPPASPPAPSDEIPILDVSMGMDGQLRLRLDDQRTETSELSADQRKRLIEILTQMRPWLEAPKPQPVQRPVGKMPSVPPPPRPAASPQKGAPPPAATPVSVPSPAPQQVPVPKPAAPLPDDDEDDRPGAPQSIVAQINSVLQARLKNSPLAGMGIRLHESLEGGVIVWVGGNKFEGVDDVPDEQIKTVIRAAITEWENKYTPG